MENCQAVEFALQEFLHVDTAQLTWLAGDASDRTYYEVHTEKKKALALMVLGKRDRELLQKGTYEWVSLQQFLAAHDIKVPHIEHLFPKLGVILIEHLGSQSLEAKVQGAKNSEEISSIYRSIFPLLTSFLHLPPYSVYTQRAFDEALLAHELRFFKTHFLEATLGLQFTSEEEALFVRDVEALASTVAKESRFFVHRDLHSRNLLIHNEAPYAIDFQDARLGSPVYDLISLVFDPYVPVEIPLRLELFEEAMAAMGRQIPMPSPEGWRPVFLQRMLKILGSYGWLGGSKNRSYLQYIPPTLSFLRAIPTYDARWPFLSQTLLERIQASARSIV